MYMAQHDTSAFDLRMLWIRMGCLMLLAGFCIWLQDQHMMGLKWAWAALLAYASLIVVGIIFQHPQIRIHLFDRSTSHLASGILFLLEYQLLTIFFYFTGGASNPFISYFLILLVMAAYRLPNIWVWGLAALGAVHYSFLTQFFQPIDTPTMSHSFANNRLFDAHLSGMWLTFILSSLALSIIIPSLLKSRQQQRQQLAAFREQQLKHEQLIGIATLAAGTAHEMGTPLMTMEMLLSELEDPDIHMNAEDIRLLRNQVQRCREALTHLATAGRNAQLQHPPIDANEWLQTQLQRWRLSHPNAQWQWEQSSNVANIPHSPLLDQALLNLLDNAAQAGLHTIQLSTMIDRDPSSIPQWNLRIHQPDPLAIKTLKNEMLPPSSPLDSQKRNGLGLGLYLSNASVEQFGGSIRLTEHEKSGSVCTLSLPTQPNDDEISS